LIYPLSEARPHRRKIKGKECVYKSEEVRNIHFPDVTAKLMDNSGVNSPSFDSGGVFDVHFYIYTSYQRLGDELVNSDQRHEPILARKALHVRYAALRVRMSLLSVRTTITVFVLA
jgi:hypothetical protein